MEGESGNTIYFCNAEGPYACFSNYYLTNIDIEGHTWPSTEHYFQSQKFTSPEYQEEIRKAPTPEQSKVLGYARRPDFRKDWESVKDAKMALALKNKFVQHADLKKILLDTGSKAIVERNDDDAYWGDGKDRKGLNKLGKILENVREELHNAK